MHPVAFPRTLSVKYYIRRIPCWVYSSPQTMFHLCRVHREWALTFDAEKIVNSWNQVIRTVKIETVWTAAFEKTCPTTKNFRKRFTTCVQFFADHSISSAFNWTISDRTNKQPREVVNSLRSMKNWTSANDFLTVCLKK